MHTQKVDTKYEVEPPLGARTDWVDYAKALGIILVVYGHVARGLYNAGITFSKEIYALIDSVIYTFHMPLFFFLSAIFFVRSFEKLGAYHFVGSKVDTIVYPYILWSLLQGSIAVFLSSFTGNELKFQDLLTLLWEPRAQFWFLYALFVTFLFFAILFSFIPKNWTPVIFLLTLGMNLLSSFIPYTIVTSYIAEFSVYFAFGLVFMHYKLIEKVAKPFFALGLGILFVLFQYIFHAQLHMDYEDSGVIHVLLTIVSIVFVCSLCGWTSIFRYKTIIFIGQASMAIYLMHIIVGRGTRLIVERILGYESFAIHITLGCALGILAPLLTYAIIQKFNIPFIFSAPISQKLFSLFPVKPLEPKAKH